MYVKKSTYATYCILIGSHIIPFLGEKCAVKENDVQDFVNSELESGLSLKTVNSNREIPHIRFHGLRHSFATRCIESKCDYKTVSALLGHSNISTTLNLYVHPGLEQKRRCIDAVARLLK